jgi:hypothetical protein
MTLSELEAFNRALALAETGNKAGAYEILTKLYRDHPDNSRVLLCIAFTAGSLEEARKVLQKASLLDPTNPSLSGAKNWLARREAQEKPRRRLPSQYGPVTVSFPVISQPYPGDGASYSEKASDLAVLLRDEPPRSEPIIPLKSSTSPNIPLYRPLSATSVNLPTVKPNRIPAALPQAAATVATPPNLDKEPRFQKIFFFWLGLLVVATVLLIGFVLVQLNPFGELTPAEKAYWQEISQINLQVNTANQQLQALEKQGLNTSDMKAGVETQLQIFIAANNRLRAIQSPSARFEEVDGLLGLAYSNYSEGARQIIEGLDKNNPQLITQGNQTLATGNDFLHKAKNELEALGLA